ncbi:MAG TPA: GNAT family N-acetyltransferase [Candidatus Xenobia bacterium]|nr:GNAT family N-acetyltransferase [Candidatus Xenobia bacterium]
MLSEAKHLRVESGNEAGPMRVREFAAHDFEAAYRLDQACYPPGIAYSRYALQEFLRLPGARAWVAEEDGRLVAFIIARRLGRGRGSIITLDVSEDHRRRGVGTRLLTTAENWLRAEGVRVVRLETATDNAAAIAFWQKAGYREIGRLRGYYLGRIDALRMEKELGG